MTQQPMNPNQPQQAEVVITMAQIYSEMQGLRGDVNTMKDVLNPAITDIRHDVSDHENRIRSLERKVWQAAGAAGAASALISGAVAYLAR